MKPKLSNPLMLLFIACAMFTAMLTVSCNDAAKQEAPKTDSIPAAATPATVTEDTSSKKKDSLPVIDTTNAPRPDGKKT